MLHTLSHFSGTYLYTVHEHEHKQLTGMHVVAWWRGVDNPYSILHAPWQY